MRLLVVEDEPKLGALIVRALRAEGHAVDLCETGEDALWRAGSVAYDAIVLDVGLPGIDGFETCRRLRADEIWSPVLMLTARDAVADRVEGLDVGADDYLVKPFSFAELAARLRALVRRGGAERPTVLAVGELRLDPARREAWRGETLAAAVGQGVRAARGLHAPARRGPVALRPHRAGLGRELRAPLQRGRRLRAPAARQDRPPVRHRLDRDGARRGLPAVRSPEQLLSSLPLRVRLTLGYTGAMAVVLAIVCAFLFLHTQTGIDQGIDDALALRAHDVAAARAAATPPRCCARPPCRPGRSAFAQVVDAGGRVVAATRRRRGARCSAPASCARRSAGAIVRDRGESLRVLAEPVGDGPARRRRRRRRSPQREHALDVLTGALLIGGPLALALAALAGYALASGALRPVEAMRSRAATISAADPDARLPLPEARDEIRRLGDDAERDARAAGSTRACASAPSSPTPATSCARR